MSYTVAQNASFLTFASIVQKVVSFAYFTIVARFVGAGNTGSYFFAIAFTTIFTVLADFGFGPVLTREASKFADKTQQYFNTVFWSKVFFGIFAYGLIYFFANLLNYSEELKVLIYLSGLTMFFDNLQSTFFGIFRAYKNLVYESFGIVISQVLSLLIGSTALFLGAPLIWLIAAYTIPSALMVLYSGFFLSRILNIKIALKFDKQIFVSFVHLSLPFAIAGILSRLYAYGDSLIMSKMLSEQHLGWWSVPYKITFAFQFIPMALSASVYPTMSSLSVSDPSRVGELFIKSWKYLFLIVFPLVFGLMAVSEPVILKLFKESYAPSINVLRILLISLIFSYLNIISGSLLNAINKQKIQTTLLFFALILNLFLNIFFISRFNIIGAAISALVSNIALWASSYYFVNKYVMLQNQELLVIALRILIISMVMGFLVYLLTLKLSFIYTIPFGIAIYAALLLLTGILDRHMIHRVLEKIMVKKSV